MLVIIAACAHALPLGNDDAGTDASSQCAQFDLTSDPLHCGSCTHACNTGEVCSSSTCKAGCDAPTTKCPSDAGSVCANTSSDPGHCGGCSTVCKGVDAGSLAPGTNNPDAGVVYDSGTGWSVGSPGCEGGSCTTDCPAGMTKCSDGICYDLQNHHDHCGTCTNACDSTTWCNKGNCCNLGSEYCGSACIDVQSDQNNCGACGNVCPSATPYCSAGTCVKGCVPTGARQPFNTMSSHTVTGCWTNSPCATDTYTFAQANGLNFQHVGENFVCSGTTACIGHVGINTYSSSLYCQGVFDVYCDSTKVGSINTVGGTCIGTAMTNSCNTSFTPMNCSTIKLQLTAGAGTDLCCSTAGTGPDTMVVGISAW